MVLGDRVGDLLEDDRLSRFGRRDDEPALSFPHRRQQIDDARSEVPVLRLEVELGDRVKRGQVFEEGLLFRHLRALEVDRLHPQQREVALAVLGRPHLPLDGVAGAQIEALDLGRRNVDVVGAGQVVVVRGTQEPIALGQNLQHAGGEDQPVLVGLGFKDLEDQVLLSDSAHPLYAQVGGGLHQPRHGQPLHVRDVHRRSVWGDGKLRAVPVFRVVGFGRVFLHGWKCLGVGVESEAP